MFVECPYFLFCIEKLPNTVSNPSWLNFDPRNGPTLAEHKPRLCTCTWLTDEVCLPRVDGVLQLIGGDAELVLRCPVNSDGVVGGSAQLISYGGRVGSYMWR